MSEKCNGFNNWETYKFSEWYSGDYSVSDLEGIKEALEEQVDTLPHGLIRDMATSSLNVIDWKELKEHANDYEEEGEESPAKQWPVEILR